MHDTPQAPYAPQVPSPRQHPADSPRRESPAPTPHVSTPHASATLAPASFAQQRLWFLAQLPGGNEAYNEPVTFTLRGRLDTTVLRRALDALVVRQQALRTRLVAVDGEVYQDIDPPETGFALVTDDLTGLPDSAARLDELRLQEATAPFDLARGPLCRGRLLTLAEDHHVLLLTVHHTVFDGRSMTVMMSELGTLYAALLDGRPSPLAPLPLQYADHARAQREHVRAGGLAEHAEFWRKQLADAPPLSGPPTDRPRPAQQDLRGGRVEFTLDAELTSALRALARQRGRTLFGAVLTGWSLLMARLSRRTDVVVGTPTANRRHNPDLSDLIGFFVNTLPLRADFSRTATAGDAVAHMGGVLRDALGHQAMPFEHIVELVNPVRSAAHTPLFQTMCAWVPERVGLLGLPGLDVTPLDIEHAPAKFDLALSLTESQGRIVGHLDYATALFDEDTARRYVRQLRHLLTDMVARPEAPVGTLKLMDDQERRLLLTDFANGRPLTTGPSSRTGSGPESSSRARSGSGSSSGTGSGSEWSPRPGSTAEVSRPESRGAGLVGRFDEQVAARAAQTALVCGDERLDYATLAGRSGRLARALADQGVGPGDIVGLHTGRSVELVVGVLGILKTGAAYLPLDPAQPPARLAAMVEDAAPVLVLSDLPDAQRPAAWRYLPAIEASADNDVPPAPAPDDERVAYVLYTSGSTGRPKGVAVTGRSVLNLFDNWVARMGATPGEATSAWSSIGFDASVHELLLPLTTGAELHLVPEELRGDPEELMEWMRQHRIVQAFLPPAYIRWIDEEPGKRLDGLALRQLLTGVESLPEAALHRMREHLADLKVCFGYGPTETTLYSTAYYDPQPLDRQCPIGRPLAGTRMYLLDEHMEPVPVGVAGEVHLGGASLAAGYLHRPDLTDERFLPDPFLPGERVYRTGDLARYLPDGNAVYVGRVDDQVKLRGFRIEPAEIETALLALPEVREAAVVVDRDTGAEPRLVAAVAVGEAPARPPHEWRAALADRLPDYMIPAVVVELPVLPLSRNGKLDRTALLRAAAETGTGQVNTQSPRDHIELTLHQIWRGILLGPDFGIRDSFFDIGGTSLSAIKMAHGIREALGTTLPVRDLMLHPTIEGLGGLIRRGRSGTPPSNLIEFRRGGTGGNVVCVHPAGGTAFCYLPLAGTLPTDVGLYGIQSPGVNPGEDFLPGVEEMAEAYLRLIEPFDDGPLVLTGLSYGGLVAHEMGRRLAGTGRTDVSVVLLDTQATEDPEARVTGTAPVDLAEFRDKLVKFNGMYPGIDDEQIDQYFRIYNHNRLTARDHLPASSAARLVLVQAVGGTTTDPATLPEVRDFWRRRAENGFRVEPLDCDHWEVLQSGTSPRVGAVLRAELAALSAPPATTPSATPATAPAVTEEA
ncbi:non-ribosomal peptide synthetase [Streptomyces tauricus]|uniref:non-ribosomal peptide synthetase n=1 Tax=Streptomyces tauricus TaxID=68274 RepID=UPI0022446102|nr:amino acid adenylation domain-containing protein [Streptomyces tauricus]MCW8098405.1 amino acid adenylation domain-containing protein [Streptomyces tauricus]